MNPLHLVGLVIVGVAVGSFLLVGGFVSYAIRIMSNTTEYGGTQ